MTVCPGPLPSVIDVAVHHGPASASLAGVFVRASVAIHARATARSRYGRATWSRARMVMSDLTGHSGRMALVAAARRSISFMLGIVQCLPVEPNCVPYVAPAVNVHPDDRLSPVDGALFYGRATSTPWLRLFVVSRHHAGLRGRGRGW